MHGMTEFEEIDYWRKRAEMMESSITNLKAETRKDVARLADLNEQGAAIEAALNAANVPLAYMDTEPLSTVQRIALLVRDRDEARKLAADAARELVELKREAELWRANEVARLDAEDGQ